MKIFRAVLGIIIFVIALISASSLALLSPPKASAGCGGPYPPKPAKIWTKSGPAGGEVTLYWDEVPYANRYAVAYGMSSGKYTYGADNIGGTNSRSYTVKGLNPGTKYAFVLAAARDCASSPFSQEVWATAGGGWMAPTYSSPSTQAPSQGVSIGPVGTQGLWAKSGPGIGQVTLYWKQADSANNYHLVYGTQAGKEQYGALNIGNTTWYTVKQLSAGRRYYFALVPTLDGRALYTTSWVSAVAASPVVEVVRSVAATEMPVPTQIQEEPQVYAPQDDENEFVEDEVENDEEEIVYEVGEEDDVEENVQGVSDEEVYINADEGFIEPDEGQNEVEEDTNIYEDEPVYPEDNPAYIGGPQE